MNTIYDGSFVLGQTSATNFVAGPGIKIDSPSAGTVRIGNDETVLFESTNADGTTLTTASPITLAEDYSNFSRMRIEYRIWADQSFKYTLEEVPCRNGYFTLSHGYINAPDNPTFYEFSYGLSGNDSKLYYAYGRFSTMGQTGLTTVDNLNIMGVTGIGRKS